MRHVVTFGRVLREAGLEVGPGRIADALTGLDPVELARRDDVYWTLRQTLVSRGEELDAVRSRVPRLVPARAARLLPSRARRPSLRLRRGAEASARRGGEAGETVESAAARTSSCARGLRGHDAGGVGARGKLIAEIAPARPLRRSRRLRPHHRGDASSTCAGSCALARDRRRPARAGVPQPRRGAAQARRPVRRLRLDGGLHAGAPALPARGRGPGAGVETFAFGTRLTRLTRELDTRDPEGALEAASARVADWPAARGSALAEGVQRRVGPAGADARRRRRDRLRRLGARGRRGRRARDGAPGTARVRGRLGQSAEGEPGLPAARRRHARGAAVRRPFLPGHNLASLEELADVLDRHREEARGVKEIAGDVERWRAEGEKVAVATVVATRRSAPRPVGAKLAISERASSPAPCPAAAWSPTSTSVRRGGARDGRRRGSLSYGIADEEALGSRPAVWRRDRRLRGGARVTAARRLAGGGREGRARRPLHGRSRAKALGAQTLVMEGGERARRRRPEEALGQAESSSASARNRAPRARRRAACSRRCTDRRRACSIYGAVDTAEALCAGGEAPRLAHDRRRRTREVRHRRAAAERRRDRRRVAGAGAGPRRARPRHGRRRAHARRQVRRAGPQRARSSPRRSTSARSARAATRNAGASGCWRRVSTRSDRPHRGACAASTSARSRSPRRRCRSSPRCSPYGWAATAASSRSPRNAFMRRR